MLKLKGINLASFSLAGVHIKELKNPSAVGLPFHRTCPSSVPDPYTSDLCFQPLTTSLHIFCQCLCVCILIVIERTMNSKIKIKIDITRYIPKHTLNSEYHLKRTAKPH